MLETGTQSKSLKYETEKPEDEIELIDLLRVIWKWKYFIIGGTVVCAVAALIISLSLPKIYRVETLIQPGILSYSDDGKSVHIDTPGNIKALIETGVFESTILKNLTESSDAHPPKILRVEVEMPNGSNMIKIMYETSRIEQGIEILNHFGESLMAEYSSVVQFFKNKIDRELNMAEAEIEKNKAIKSSHENNVSNIEKRIYDLRTELSSVTANTDYLKKERNELLSKDKSESNILSAILYSNTIQQNLQLENEYENEIKDLQLNKEEELQITSDLKNAIKKQLAVMDGLKIKKSNINNVKILRKPYVTPSPVKPRIYLNVAVASFIGLFTMTFLAFFIEYISRHRGRIA